MRPPFRSILFLILSFTWPKKSACLSPHPAANLIKDYSGQAAGLFNNMRTPAALISGAIVPVGILSAPSVEENDSPRLELFKKANCLLAIASLISEILAVTYSTVAINKLAEVKFPPTSGVDELISQHFELAWIGTNVHFLLGMFGFGLLVGNKAFLTYGRAIGRISACWSVAAFLQCTSIVNKGIAMGGSGVSEQNTRFATNLLTLTLKYIWLVCKSARNSPLSLTALGIIAYSMFVIFISLSSFKESKRIKC